jgi:protein-L-isoaspartate(D-aspartate) O-methyltransferase
LAGRIEVIVRYEDQQKWMIEQQLIARNINDERVLQAFLKVPRYLFVPFDLRHLAYEDCPLAIGEGQTISQPFTVAFMLQIADLKPEHRVLEIGTGSGYQTALLSEMVEEIYTIDRIAPLSQRAQHTLWELNYRNITFYIGDGTKGWHEAKFFDRIIVTAGAPEVPSSLLNQLKIGGKMVIPAGSNAMQNMLLITKKENSIVEETFGGFRFVPLIGEEGWKR